MPEAMNDIEVRKKRALYRANHRGTKEMDILLGKFANEQLVRMDEQELELFEKFISEPDRELEGWVIRNEYKHDGEFSPIVLQLRDYHGLA